MKKATPQKAKAPTVAAAGALKRKQSSLKFNPKSTRTEAQEQRIVAALRGGPKTTDELRALGCYQVSARVFGLRKRGHNIATELFEGYAADGYSHARMARYTLLEQAEATLPLPKHGKRAKRRSGSRRGCK